MKIDIFSQIIIFIFIFSIAISSVFCWVSGIPTSKIFACINVLMLLVMTVGLKGGK